jgi:hypothetical protein
MKWRSRDGSSTDAFTPSAVLPVLCSAFFAVVLVPFAFTFLGISGDLPLNGAVQTAVKPVLGLGRVLDGSWQKSFDAWYKENYPLRDFAIKTYNQFKYSVLDKSSTDSTTFIGNDLVETVYIEESLTVNFPSRQTDRVERVDRYAADVLAVQKGLEKAGRKFLYVITPSKDHLVADVLPARYTLNDHTDLNPNNRTLLIAAFDRLGVHYYDAVVVVDQLLTEGRYRPFSTTGTHWNLVSAAAAAQGLVHELNRIYRTDLPPPVLRGVQRVATPQGEDSDLLRLQNLWKGRLDKEYYAVDIGYDLPAGFVVPNLCYYGTSFGYQLLQVLETGDAYHAVDVFKYLDKRNAAGIFPQQKLGAYGIDFRSLVARDDLFLMESVSSFLPVPHEAFVEAFADYFENGPRFDFEVRDGNGSIDIVLKDSTALSARAGETIDIPLTLFNRTTNVTLSSSYDPPFSLSYHILDSSGVKFVQEVIRTPIADVGPSSSLDTAVRVLVPTTKGRYVLQITFVQENRLWGERYTDALPVEIDLVVD